MPTLIMTPGLHAVIIVTGNAQIENTLMDTNSMKRFICIFRENVQKEDQHGDYPSLFEGQLIALYSWNQPPGCVYVTVCSILVKKYSFHTVVYEYEQ